MITLFVYDLWLFMSRGWGSVLIVLKYHNVFKDLFKYKSIFKIPKYILQVNNKKLLF